MFGNNAGFMLKLPCSSISIALIVFCDTPSCSNEERNLLEKEFINVFDDILISNYVNAFKPNSNFYEKLIEISKVKPNEILFLDDNIDNIKGAEKLGIKTLLVNKNDNIHENIIKILK